MTTQWHKPQIVTIFQKKIHLGRFPSERDAALVYDRTAILAFGEFAHTNFPAHESACVVLSARVLDKIEAVRQRGTP